ncbi:MAG: DUF2339 domain-containing protein [Candidatus Hydrogenedentales bacterium]
MAAELPEDVARSDPAQRIDALERRVGELTALVDHLSHQLMHAVHDDSHAAITEAEYPAFAPEPAPQLPPKESWQQRLSLYLGGVEGETLESRIGGIWLSRIAVVLAMTAIVLGGAMTLRDQGLLPWHKIAVGYAIASAALLYGLLRARRNDLFAHTMLGTGLAVLYFTTYAAFFIDSTRVFTYAPASLPVLLGCLALLAIVCHVYRSQTAAGIALFLIYYTVALSLSEHQSLEEVLYSLATAALVSLIALIFHATHRWMLFTWGALVATHLTYIFFFVIRPPELDLPEKTYFWVSNGFLLFSYVVFSVACITDAHRTGKYRKDISPMAGVNSFVFLVLTWVAIRDVYPEFEWAFRLGIAGMMLLFAAYAGWAGPRYNYLFQIFIAKAVIIFTLALQAYLSHEWLLIAMAIEGLGLAISYHRSGAFIFKLLALVLMAVTFVSTMLSVRIAGTVTLFDYTVPANWFSVTGVAVVFAVTAAFYEHFVRKIAPEDRVVKMQWWMADTRWDWSHHTVALMHAVAAAVLLMTITIFHYGEDPRLPFVLAGEGAALAFSGFILFASPVEVASVLLLVAAHAVYHIFMFIGIDGFQTQQYYVALAAALAGITFLGGLLWERYLRSIHGGRQWEHHALASLPHLAATYLLATLLTHLFLPVYAPAAQAAAGAALLLLSATFALPGLLIAGAFAFGLAGWDFYDRLYQVGDSIASHSQFLFGAGAMLLMLAIGERCIRLFQWRTMVPAGPIPAVRTAIVVAAAGLGFLALWESVRAELLSYYWLGFAVVFMVFGVAFRDSRYRWAAMALYLVTIVRAYFYDLAELSPLLSFLSFAVLCIPLLIISWAYSHYRNRQLRRLQPPPTGAAVDG